ncbi:unnamed protein product [Paramecium primaurelia]|uniref:Uncharacterized protein n=2 Tax=Paramecium TaxID=5884 RepID=A0A8S1WD99_9CILI|nr:unnamed protein product [Paramecium primaurelia]CAD8186585.1 unnamed protein product [Paramecium pentaurelia]
MFLIKPQTPTFGDKKQSRKPQLQINEINNNSRFYSVPTRQTQQQSRSSSIRKKNDLLIKKWKELYEEQTSYYMRLLKVNGIQNIELPKFQLQK